VPKRKDSLGAAA